MAKDLVKYEQAVNGEWPTVPNSDKLEDMERIVLYELYEGFVRSGRAMERILTGRLYEQRGYLSVKEYFDSGTAPCKERHARQLIAAANLRVKLGKPSATAPKWSEWALRPLTSIEPVSQAVRLGRECQKQARHDGLGEVPRGVVGSVIREFKGKMPAEKAEKAKALQLADTPAEVVEIGLQRVKELQSVFKKFTGSMWEDVEADAPGSVKRLAQACSDLASYLRS